jgi:hypothetical protein
MTSLNSDNLQTVNTLNEHQKPLDRKANIQPLEKEQALQTIMEDDTQMEQTKIQSPTNKALS